MSIAVYGSTGSLWERGVRRPERPPLRGHIDVDVAVVGGGITGLTAALLLASSRREVVLVDAARVGSGTTGANSAHITDVPDLRHRRLLNRFGEKTARVVLDRGRAALECIADLVAAEAIECDFRRVSGYLFTEDDSQLGELEDEARAADHLGRPCAFSLDVPLPWPVAGAVMYPEQIGLHPLRYALGLAELVTNRGGTIHEQSPVIGLREVNGAVWIQTAEGEIHAQHAILATHVPIGFALVQTEVAPYRSYLLSLVAERSMPDGLFWDTAEPYHYLRRVDVGDASLVLVGGADHKTGQESDPSSRFAMLERYAAARLGVTTLAHQWSAQLYEPADGLPYVGRVAGTDNLYLATGFAGTGLVYGTMAAIELAAAIRGETRENPFDPVRINLAAAPRLISENANVAVQWVGDRLSGGDVGSLRDVPPGEGRIVRVAGRRRAVFRAEDGTFHVLSPTCTHLGCQVRWNGAERTWDCPCHGARYEPTGAVREGPALRGLERELTTDSVEATNPAVR
jgi:glycine/D-amino acid oxidase-like deaminating enzyme/nitrite reductase/ring-hydroxylating ferredoxin subunit